MAPDNKSDDWLACMGFEKTNVAYGLVRQGSGVEIKGSYTTFTDLRIFNMDGDKTARTFTFPIH